jgi:hypothetical protein
MPVRSQEKAYHDERSYSNRGATYPNSARPAGIPAASAWISPWCHSHPLRGSNARGVRRTHRGRLGGKQPSAQRVSQWLLSTRPGHYYWPDHRLEGSPRSGGSVPHAGRGIATVAMSHKWQKDLHRCSCLARARDIRRGSDRNADGSSKERQRHQPPQPGSRATIHRLARAPEASSTGVSSTSMGSISAFGMATRAIRP